MVDYIGTVRRRYERPARYLWQFSLQYPKAAAQQTQPVPKKERLRDMLRPQFLGLSKKIQEEIAAIMQRWTGAREKTVLHTVNKQLDIHSKSWRGKLEKTEKIRGELAKKSEMKTQLLFRDTEKQIKRLEKSISDLHKQEEEKKRTQERMEQEARPVSRRGARRMIAESAEDVSEAVTQQMQRQLRGRERQALRQMRDAQRYDAMRRAERNKR